jgi:hypothetical protein
MQEQEETCPLNTAPIPIYPACLAYNLSLLCFLCAFCAFLWQDLFDDGSTIP